MADPMMSPAAPMPQGGMAPNAAPADEDAPPSPQETETFETMVAGLLEYIYPPGSDQPNPGIVQQLREAKDPAGAAGNVTLLLVQEAAKQAEAAGLEFDMDMLLGVATEVIESLMKLAKASKVKITDDETFMAGALFAAIQGYIASTPPGSEEQDAAKAMLAQMQQAGMVDEGAAELQRLGQKAGVDPFAQAEAPPQDSGAPQGGGLISQMGGA